jgi:hypothetical protein
MGLKAVSSGKLWHPAGKIVKNSAKKELATSTSTYRIGKPQFFLNF